uniref:GDSL esterase/lipase n=1 Tax=Setaria italica TaxID=4555 RepID=K3XYN0_SETIT
MEAVAGSIRFSLFNRLISHQTVFLSQLAKQIMGGLLLRLVICVQVLIGTVAVGARPPATAMYVFPPPVTFPSRGVGAHRTVAAGARSPATAMYVFGSSILDVGNNNYLPGASVARANRRYNGIDFPSSIPTGRFSNGYNIADYVAKSMGFASSPPAYLSLAPSSGPLVQNAVANGISYASGGAGILDSTNAGNTIRLSKQVQYFGTTKAKMVAALGPNVANALLSRSIFLIGIGNNDMYVFESAERAQNRSAVEQRRETAVLYVPTGTKLQDTSCCCGRQFSIGW